MTGEKMTRARAVLPMLVAIEKKLGLPAESAEAKSIQALEGLLADMATVQPEGREKFARQFYERRQEVLDILGPFADTRLELKVECERILNLLGLIDPRTGI